MLVPNAGNVNAPINTGSAVQVEYAADSPFVDLSTTVPAGQNVTSAAIATCGYRVFGIGLTSSQNGTLSVQRYLDADGTIPQDSDAPFSVGLVAGEAATMNVMDGKPFQSMKITVSNSSGSEATIDPFILLLQAY